MSVAGPRRALAASALAAAGLAAAAEPTFGELPEGAVSTSETRGVAAEICRDHLFDPAAAAARLPAGVRLVTASEAAGRNPALEALLQARPALRSHALGSLCFLSVGELLIDGEPVPLSGPLPVAFWWARADVPHRAQMRGRAGWVQLGSWYPPGLPNAAAVSRTDPMAEFVDVRVDRVDADRWRVRLVLPAETVSAEVTMSGPRVPSRAAQPGFMSLAMAGPAVDHFTVFTYFGHHHRSARGTWQASGSGVFGGALSIAGEAEVFGSVFQDGWASRAGLYRVPGR